MSHRFLKADPLRNASTIIARRCLNCMRGDEARTPIVDAPYLERCVCGVTVMVDATGEVMKVMRDRECGCKRPTAVSDFRIVNLTGRRSHSRVTCGDCRGAIYAEMQEQVTRDASDVVPISGGARGVHGSPDVVTDIEPPSAA